MEIFVLIYLYMELLDIYKQSQIHKTIQSDRKSNMLNHCYLLSSSDTFLIDNFAYFVAKEICCLSEEKPCNSCVNCLKIEHGNMVDLIVFPKDDKNLMVEDINNIVIDCYITPIENEKKIYILKNFDLCTVQAQNKILKTLEEPPKNVIFILTCTNQSLVLPTISSRAKKISEPVLAKEIVEKYLTEQKINNSSIIASMSDGNLEIASKLAKNNETINIVNLVFDVLYGLKSSADILRFSSKILALKKDIKFFLDSLILILRDVSISSKEELINFSDRKEDVIRLAQMYNKDMVKSIVGKISKIFENMEFNCNMTGQIDKLLLDILEVKFLCQK